MRILVIGSGGREHALCDAFRRSQSVESIFCAAGNAGIAQIATCVSIDQNDVRSLTRFALDNSIDLTFVGGEEPLSLGIVDEFEKLQLPIIGPTRSAARLESSKSFAKKFMRRHNIPTANFAVASSAGEAVKILEGGFSAADEPVVVKADGLAAGKGVIVAANREEAVRGCRELEARVGAAANSVVIEECLEGREISLLIFASGEEFSLMPPVRDHKRLKDGDLGPNTGGMGTVTDGALVTDADLRDIVESVVRPTLRGCTEDGFPFRGILFFGLMMTPDGAKVLEYNTRFGDPETQSIIVRLKTDLTEICGAMLADRLSDLTLNWQQGSSACVVLAAKGYPHDVEKGAVIRGLSELARGDAAVKIYHAGTAFNEGGEFAVNGGRVLGITAAGSDLGEALERVYASVDMISFDGMQYRRDIGTR